MNHLGVHEVHDHACNELYLDKVGVNVHVTYKLKLSYCILFEIFEY